MLAMLQRTAFTRWSPHAEVIRTLDTWGQGSEKVAQSLATIAHIRTPSP